MAKDLFYGDADPVETGEWLDAFESVIENEGADRARCLLERLSEKANSSGVRLTNLNTAYLNTIAPEDQPQYPGDPYIERRIRSLIRWNALAMVMRANLSDDELGGHISSFASSATLYDIGFNHFFKHAGKFFRQLC